MSNVSSEATRGAPSGAPGLLDSVLPVAKRNWWLLLITGMLWTIVSIVVFRFDYGSVQAIATLFGFIALGTAANELMISMFSTPGWRVVHILLAVAFAVIGIVAFINPGNTFVALAAVVSFYLVFRGSFDVVVALSSAATTTGSWILGITGIAELLLGFWAAGSWGISATLLVSWVGATALLHGLGELVGAFRLRALAHRFA